MVVGNLGLEGGFEKTTEWVENQISTIGKTLVLDIYTKGDYRGMHFCKFDSQNPRDTCVSRLRRASPQRKGQKTYFLEDQSVEIRVCFSILFGARRLMLGWGESQNKI